MKKKKSFELRKECTKKWSFPRIVMVPSDGWNGPHTEIITYKKKRKNCNFTTNVGTFQISWLVEPV